MTILACISLRAGQCDIGRRRILDAAYHRPTTYHHTMPPRPAKLLSVRSETDKHLWPTQSLYWDWQAPMACTSPPPDKHVCICLQPWYWKWVEEDTVTEDIVMGSICLMHTNLHSQQCVLYDDVFWQCYLLTYQIDSSMTAQNEAHIYHSTMPKLTALPQVWHHPSQWKQSRPWSRPPEDGRELLDAASLDPRWV